MRIEGAENESVWQESSGDRERGRGRGGGEEDRFSTSSHRQMTYPNCGFSTVCPCTRLSPPLVSPRPVVPVRRIYRGEERTGRSEMEIGGAARTRARRVAMVVVGEGNWSGERVAKRWW